MADWDIYDTFAFLDSQFRDYFFDDAAGLRARTASKEQRLHLPVEQC